MMHLKIRHTLIAGLLVSLLLGACSNKKEASLESGGVASSDNSSSAGESIESESNAVPADITAAGGKVLLVKGFNLYSWELDSPEVLEAENIDPNQIYFTPDEEYLLYSIRSEEDRRQILDIEMMHVASGVKTHLTRVEGRFARPAPNWWLHNADMERGWFMIGLWTGRQDSILVKSDGSQRFDLGTTNNLQPIWLADDTLLGLEYDWNQLAQLNELSRVWRFDPAVGTLQVIDDLDVAQYQDNWGGLMVALEGRGIQFTEPPLDPNSEGFFADGLETTPVDGNWSDICNVWAIRQHNGEATTTIYESGDVAQITGVFPLPDGSYLVGERTYTNCDIDLPTANLRRVVPDGDALLLTDTLDPGVDGFGFGAGWNLSVSPDSRYLLWIGGGILTGESTLNLTDLTTNTTTVLRQEAFDIVRDGSVGESARYKRVHWITS